MIEISAGVEWARDVPHSPSDLQPGAGEPGRERERTEKNASAATRGEGCEQEGMCEVGQMCSRMSHTRTK